MRIAEGMPLPFAGTSIGGGPSTSTLGNSAWTLRRNCSGVSRLMGAGLISARALAARTATMTQTRFIDPIECSSIAEEGRERRVAKVRRQLVVVGQLLPRRQHRLLDQRLAQRNRLDLEELADPLHRLGIAAVDVAGVLELEV